MNNSFRFKYKISYTIVSYVNGVATAASGVAYVHAFNREDAISRFRSGFRIGSVEFGSINDSIKIEDVDVVD